MNNNKKTKKKHHNGEGSIRQKPNGRYEVRISGRDMETGKSTRISKYADTLDEAVDIQHALSVAMVQTPQYLQNNTTVGEWLDNWLSTYMQHTLKQSTYKSYETYVRKHFKPSLGTIKLKELTPRTLQIFYNYKQEQENLSPKTISNLNMCLHKALAQAQSEGLILSNPSGSVSLPPLIKPHIEVLTREQQARLVQASYQFRYGVFVRMTLVTGLRLGEVVGLRWCDIDFYTNMLHVNQTLNRLQRYDDDEADSKTEIVTQTPKSQNSIRSIPMLPELVMDLQNWRTVQMQDAAAMGRARHFLLRQRSDCYAGERPLCRAAPHARILPEDAGGGQSAELQLSCTAAYLCYPCNGAGHGCENAFDPAGTLFCWIYAGYLCSCAD